MNCAAARPSTGWPGDAAGGLDDLGLLIRPHGWTAGLTPRRVVHHRSPVRWGTPQASLDCTSPPRGANARCILRQAQDVFWRTRLRASHTGRVRNPGADPRPRPYDHPTWKADARQRPAYVIHGDGRSGERPYHYILRSVSRIAHPSAFILRPSFHYFRISGRYSLDPVAPLVRKLTVTFAGSALPRRSRMPVVTVTLYCIPGLSGSRISTMASLMEPS